MSRTIRPYQDRDLDGVMLAWEEASKLAHPFLTEEFLASERFNIPNLYLPAAETWIVEQDGSVIGFMALIGNEIGAIFVRPEFHGKGAGTALIDKAKDLRGDLEVEVFRENAIGRGFYAGCGFKPLSESVHEQTGNPLLRLRRPAGEASPATAGTI